MTTLSKRAWAAAVVFPAMVLVACCPAPALKPVVQVPELPALPTVKAGEMQCLDADVYARLVTREVIHRETLEQCQEMLREMVDGT